MNESVSRLVMSDGDFHNLVELQSVHAGTGKPSFEMREFDDNAPTNALGTTLFKAP
jgi:hypothetical protein